MTISRKNYLSGERRRLNDEARKRNANLKEARGAYCRWCQATESNNATPDSAKAKRDNLGFVAGGKGNSSKRRPARS